MKERYPFEIEDNPKVSIKDNNKNILRPNEAANHICCSYCKIMDMVRRKQIPHYRIGNRVLFRRDALDEWIMKQEEKVVVNIEDGEWM